MYDHLATFAPVRDSCGTVVTSPGVNDFGLSSERSETLRLLKLGRFGVLGTRLCVVRWVMLQCSMRALAWAEGGLPVFASRRTYSFWYLF